MGWITMRHHFRPMYFESFPMQAVIEEHFGVRRDEELDEPVRDPGAILEWHLEKWSQL